MTRVGIAIGSNLGDSETLLQAAADALAAIAVPGEPVLRAPHYRTTPVDCPPGSPDFLNSVIEIAWAGNARELLTATRQIEREFGRTISSVRNAPRLLDLDLLYFGNETVSSEALTLPHPRLTSRLFVLAPLADIRPDLILPGQRETVAELFTRLQSSPPFPQPTAAS